jgi:hypothetical protein
MAGRWTGLLAFGAWRRAFPGGLWPSQWHRATRYPITVAGPRRFRTGLPLTTDRMWRGVYLREGPQLTVAEVNPRPGLLALALLDLALELLDHLGHGLAHPRELPVLDLDHPEP